MIGRPRPLTHSRHHHSYVKHRWHFSTPGSSSQSSERKDHGEPLVFGQQQTRPQQHPRNLPNPLPSSNHHHSCNSAIRHRFSINDVQILSTPTSQIRLLQPSRSSTSKSATNSLFQIRHRSPLHRHADAAAAAASTTAIIAIILILPSKPKRMPSTHHRHDTPAQDNAATAVAWLTAPQ